MKGIKNTNSAEKILSCYNSSRLNSNFNS